MKFATDSGKKLRDIVGAVGMNRYAVVLASIFLFASFVLGVGRYYVVQTFKTRGLTVFSRVAGETFPIVIKNRLSESLLYPCCIQLGDSYKKVKSTLIRKKINFEESPVIKIHSTGYYLPVNQNLSIIIIMLVGSRDSTLYHYTVIVKFLSDEMAENAFAEQCSTLVQLLGKPSKASSFQEGGARYIHYEWRQKYGKIIFSLSFWYNKLTLVEGQVYPVIVYELVRKKW